VGAQWYDGLMLFQVVIKNARLCNGYGRLIAQQLWFMEVQFMVNGKENL
jgi:hypothetical protein